MPKRLPYPVPIVLSRLVRFFLATTIAWSIPAPPASSESPLALLRVEVGRPPVLGCYVEKNAAPVGFQAARELDVSEIWSGTAVDFDAFVFGKTLYAAYYDADRYVTIAKIDLASGSAERMRLDSRFEGWDNHNYIRLSLDSTKAIHLAANMHASPLVYFQGTEPFSIASMRRVHLAGIGVDRVTYPTFISGTGSDLAFFYRNGMSGNGAWFIARWNGTRWEGSVPLLADHDGGAAVSAYPSPAATGPDGMVHLAIVWRRTPDVRTNFRLSYVRTKNFSEWYDLYGRRITLPINPESATLVDDTGPGSGLLNNAQISVDTRGRPEIAYTKYGSDGGNAIILAAPDTASRWHHVAIAESDHRAEISGGGTLPTGPGVHALSHSSADHPTVAYAFANEPRMSVEVDPVTLMPVSTPRPDASDVNCYFRTHRTDLINWHASQHAVRDLNQPSHPIVGDLIWETQGAVNRDQPYFCTAAKPTACLPPATMLRFVYFPSE